MTHAGANHEELLSALPPEAPAMIGLVGDADAMGARLEAYAVGSTSSCSSRPSPATPVASAR
jgi:hypothetical protein